MKGINIKDRNYELYSVAKNNEVFTMELTKQDLIKYASELQERINKAIEYVNRFESINAYYEYQDGEYWETDYDDDFQKDLLNILKGNDKSD